MVKNFIQSITFGALAIIGAFIVQAFLITIISILTRDYTMSSVFQIENTFLAILIVAIIEETFRIIFIKRILEISSTSNILLKGFSFGFGFSLIELFFISKNIFLNPSILSLISIFVFHTILSIVIFHNLHKYRDTFQLFISFTIAVSAHVIYNIVVNSIVS